METELVNIISSVGFPIVACIYMAYVHNESEKRHSDERATMTQVLTEMNKLLDNDTEAITEMNKLLVYIKSILERETKA